MKVLHICNDYRDNNLYNQLFKLLAEDIEQTVFVPFKNQLEIKSIENYKVIHKVCYKNSDRIFFNIKGRKIFKVLQNEVSLPEYDLIHAHTLFSNGIIALLTKKRYGTEYVISVRNVDVDFFMKNFFYLRKSAIKILLNSKKIIFISPVLKKKFLTYIKEENVRKEIEEKSLIISNGIDDFWLKNKFKENEFINELKVIQVGWIGNNKNQLNSVKAIELLNKRNIPCELNIIGGVANKKYYSNLLKYIENSHYKEKIQVMESKDKSELINLYRESNIYLMPSFSETFGLTYIEAMSQGLPIIYSENQGVDMLFDDAPVGMHVTPNCPEDIGEKIVLISENLEFYKDNIDCHLSKFTWQRVKTKLLKDVYN